MKYLLLAPLLLMAGCGQTISTQENADIRLELQAIANDSIAKTPESIASLQRHVQKLAKLFNVTVSSTVVTP